MPTPANKNVTSGKTDHRLLNIVDEITENLQSNEPVELEEYVRSFPEFRDYRIGSFLSKKVFISKYRAAGFNESLIFAEENLVKV